MFDVAQFLPRDVPALVPRFVYEMTSVAFIAVSQVAVVHFARHSPEVLSLVLLHLVHNLLLQLRLLVHNKCLRVVSVKLDELPTETQLVQGLTLVVKLDHFVF